MPRPPRSAASTEHLTSGLFSSVARRLAQHAGPLFPLHVGDTHLEPPPAALDELRRCLDREGLHGYAATSGEPVLLDAIHSDLARRGDAPPPDAVQVVSGATVGLSLACQTVLEPGDEVLLPSPYWPLIRGIIASRGATPVQVPVFTRLDEEGFDLESTLDRAVTERTTALYLNTPHNPTGRILTDDQVEAVGRVAARHDLWILSDEVYERLWLEREPPAPAWSRASMRERTIATHSLSKSHALAGARIGFTHGPPDVMARFKAVQVHQTYCATRLMQHVGARALAEGDAWLSDVRRAYGTAAKRAAEALGTTVPAAGTFLFVDAAPFLREGEGVPELLSRCLDEGVVLTPGASCGSDFERWIRLCFTTVHPETLDDALSRLRRVLRPEP